MTLITGHKPGNGIQKMEAKESGSLFLYAITMQRGKTCYKGAIANNTWKATQPISAQESVASGCMLQNLKNGWSNKTGMIRA